MSTPVEQYNSSTSPFNAFLLLKSAPTITLPPVKSFTLLTVAFFTSSSIVNVAFNPEDVFSHCTIIEYQVLALIALFNTIDSFQIPLLSLNAKHNLLLVFTYTAKDPPLGDELQSKYLRLPLLCGLNFNAIVPLFLLIPKLYGTPPPS